MDKYDKCKEIREQIDKLEQQYNEIAEPFDTQIADIETEIKKAAIVAKHSFKTKYGKVGYRKGYIRTSWDTKMLLGYAVAHKEVLEFKKETEIKPSVTIKIVDK